MGHLCSEKHRMSTSCNFWIRSHPACWIVSVIPVRCSIQSMDLIFGIVILCKQWNGVIPQHITNSSLMECPVTVRVMLESGIGNMLIAPRSWALHKFHRHIRIVKRLEVMSNNHVGCFSVRFCNNCFIQNGYRLCNGEKSEGMQLTAFAKIVENYASAKKQEWVPIQDSLGFRKVSSFYCDEISSSSFDGMLS